MITFISLVTGCLFGLIFKEKSTHIELLGSAYLKALKIMIFPVIFTGISYSAYKSGNEHNTLILKTVFTFIVMFLCTFLLTSALVLIIDPSAGFTIEDSRWDGTVTAFDLKDMLLNLLPKSLSDIFINPKVFFIIVVAFIIGKIGSLLKLKSFFEGMRKIRDVIYEILNIFMYLTPVATFSLMANTIFKNGAAFLGVGLKYILTAYFCSVVAMVVMMMLPVKLKAGIGFKEYISKVYRIWMMTISTCSSAATLPFTVKLCKEEFGIPEEITDVVVPLGCTIHMCGGAVSFALLGIFCLKIYGMEISVMTFLMMVISSLMINMAAPGIPNGGVVIGATYLQIFGIPLGFIGFYSGIYKLLDMCYTTLNVSGDISANILINEMK